MKNWEVLKELGRMQREMDEVLRGFGLGGLTGASVDGAALRGWPRVNLREDDNHLYVEALLPGISAESIDMHVLGNTLTISGERKGAEIKENGCTWHRRERGIGRFLRTIELPVEIDAGRVTAEFSNGLLCVTLAKAEAAKPKKISIELR